MACGRRSLAQEVLKGLTQKAKLGGTPYKAPIGYLNLRSLEGGKDVRSIGIDPERADLVRWCFEHVRHRRLDGRQPA